LGLEAGFRFGTELGVEAHKSNLFTPLIAFRRPYEKPKSRNITALGYLHGLILQFYGLESAN